MRWIDPLSVLFLAAIAAPGIFMMNQLDAIASPIPPQAGNAGVENSTPLKIDRLDPSVDGIIPADAKLERIATGFTWTEGPVWAGNSLFFADIPANTIHKWTPGAGASTFLKPSGYKESAPYGGPEPGSNGMTLDVHGRITVAGHGQRNVYRLESLDPQAPATIL